MSTSAYVAILLKKKDRNRQLVSLINPKYTVNPSGYEYLYMIINSDGYLFSLGKNLLKNYKTYDNVLSMILCGDQTTFGDPYIEYRNERWDLVKPNITDEPEHSGYSYVFEKNQWWFFKDTNGESIRTKLTDKIIENNPRL